MALATVYKDSFKVSMPWMVQIAPCTVLGIKGGKMGPWATKKQAQAWADSFNELYPEKVDFEPGDQVKFYDGDDVNVTYGIVTSVFKNTCVVVVEGPEQPITYSIKKSKLNYN